MENYTEICVISQPKKIVRFEGWFEVGKSPLVRLFASRTRGKDAANAVLAIENFFLAGFFGLRDAAVTAAMYRLSVHQPPLEYTSEDCTDLKEGDTFLCRETCKELLDRRVEQLMSNEHLEHEIAHLNGVLLDALEAARIFAANRSKVKRNRHVFDHLQHASELLEQKARQALLFVECEKLLKSGACWRMKPENCARGWAVSNEMSRG